MVLAFTEEQAIGSNPVRVVRPAHYRIDERMMSLHRRKNKRLDKIN